MTRGLIFHIDHWSRHLNQSYGASDNSDSESSEMGSALTPDMSALDPALAGFLADRLVFAGVEDEPVDLRAYIERMG
jgi:hypothetical protein